MKNVMVDLETLGTVPGCAILSIGAVAFDPESGKLGEEFYVVVRRSSNGVFGLHEDAQTLKWWELQSKEARRVLYQSEGIDSIPINRSLDYFKDYLAQFNLNKVEVWGNGSDFDNAILAVAYQKVGLELPWRFWNNRCYRTLKAEYRGSSKLVREGTYHNALDDARCQAEHCIQILQEKSMLRRHYSEASNMEDARGPDGEALCAREFAEVGRPVELPKSKLPLGATPKK